MLRLIFQAVGNVGAPNTVFWNAGDGRDFTATHFGGATDITYWVVVGDVNGDGYPDIGVANSEGPNGIHLNRSGTGPGRE